MDGTTVSAVTTAMNTALTTSAGEALNAVATLAPVAVPVMTGIVIIGIGLKVFRKVTGRV